jgi:hypothetical protein
VLVAVATEHPLVLVLRAQLTLAVVVEVVAVVGVLEPRAVQVSLFCAI